MAYVALIGEGEDAERALEEVDRGRNELRVLTRRPGLRVLYDTNIAREFVRDVKAKITTGKLTVIRYDAPHEVFEPGKEEA